MAPQQIAFEDAVLRARAEYLEMPGLSLTMGQAARLWGLGVEECREVLAELLKRNFLYLTPSGQFVRADSLHASAEERSLPIRHRA